MSTVCCKIFLETGPYMRLFTEYVNSCKCIGQKKIADACIGQIFNKVTIPHILFLKYVEFIFDFEYLVKRARIKCIYAITYE